MKAVSFGGVVYVLERSFLVAGLIFLLTGMSHADDRRQVDVWLRPVLPPVMVPGPLLWGFAIWPGRFCQRTMSYPSDEELTDVILKNLQKDYPEYFVMSSSMTKERLLAEFPGCCPITPAPYLVRLLTSTRVKYDFEFRYSKFGRELPNVTLMGEATACGTLGFSQRMFDCLEGYVEGTASICSVSKKKKTGALRPRPR
jgi:hypothetical protein